MIAWAFDAVIGSTLLMLLVLAVRRPVAHLFGATWAYALWLLPALRLVMPQMPSLTTPVSVPSITVVLPAVERAAAAPLPVDAGPGQWVSILLALWIGGAAAFLIWHQSAYSAFLLSIGSTPRKGDPEEFGGIRVIESEAVDGPVAIGVFDKRIVVPPLFNWRYSAAEQQLALEHELIHHRRGDLWWNMLALGVLALNWFNPIAHFAFRAFRADQELACDAAIARKAPDRRHDYASALVKAASRPGLVAACPLNHAEFLKRRLKLMKSHRATRARTLGGVAAVGILAAGGLALSSPGFAQRDDDVGEVVVQAMERDGALITPAEEAAIREKCGEAATGSHGISLRGRDGALVCENGKVVDDPEARAIVGRVTERARTRVETVMNDPAVVAAIDGEATRAAEAAVAAIDEAEIARAVAEAETAVRAVDLGHVHGALAEARAGLAAIDIDKIRAAAMAPAMASVAVDVPHVQLSAADRAEIEASIAEARAEIASAQIDRAEIARSLAEARNELREAHRERQEALREAHRERQDALLEAQRERRQALREAEHERRRALHEAETWREKSERH
ncbi:M56 family metallopeptidase [Sphingosinicella humi]|uniref:Peptidase M56 domain-containing protein n=1 Tax=Allosphingosinicella humi TaxID=2068657 RepID=A0A2U2IZK6_9SPHN|nr:M56 family metallopeptidase [Sphingosinicella humi]PWG01461.1 hypothetical protein DF286_00190 [Sphingosinicella humi]